jgi:antitoxin component YwqK of YwqJK toxin-antitoxin module
LNGEKNGKSKEYYDNGQLKFEGEYLDGKKNGKSKEYYDNGRLKFEGEYLNGKRWNGYILSNTNKNFKFVIKNGNGKIKVYNNKGELIFEGDYINGVKKGKEYNYNNKLIFEGEYFNEEKWNGKIFEYSKKIKHTKCGFGRYERNFLKDYYIKAENEKEKVFNNIVKFEGEYLNGKRNGKGKEYDTFGKLINEGIYINGKRKEEIYNSQYDRNYYYVLIFEGEIKNGVKNGKGKEYNYNSGKLIFEGEYLNGIRWNGIGNEYLTNWELEKQFEYLNGEINGKGKEFTYG